VHVAPACTGSGEGFKPLVDKLDKLSPLRRPVIALDKGVPLSCVAGHVEGRQEHFASFLCFLDAEQLPTPVEPRKRISAAVVSWEQQFMAVACCRCNGISARLQIAAIADDYLLRLEPIDCNCQLALIPLHGGHRSRQVVDHCAHVGDLLVGGLGFWWLWRGHGERVGREGFWWRGSGGGSGVSGGGSGRLCYQDDMAGD
jgi:hypothetical protein